MKQVENKHHPEEISIFMKFLNKIRYLYKPKQYSGMTNIQRQDTLTSATKKINNYLVNQETTALHLGCGNNNLKEWLNIDIGGNADIFWDFNKRFDFINNDTFDYIYSEHVIEHFSRKMAKDILCQMFEKLKSNGVIRIAVPDLEQAIDKYINYRPSDHQGIIEEAQAMYGEVYGTKGEFLDVCLRGWGHCYLYNEEDLKALLLSSGFQKVYRCNHRTSRYPIFNGIETRPEIQSSLVIEACK